MDWAALNGALNSMRQDLSNAVGSNNGEFQNALAEVHAANAEMLQGLGDLSGALAGGSSD